ncbi:MULTISPECIES: hypothetical protein [Pseudomonadati]|uniref:Uncharacterized protein n=1 Tax=Shewanella aestuarii TaxID=1028752 RepID=A0ABT0KXF0_9GAMM|nr:hypothetical protein [Shewanella aestuarii]MCL1115940.1 hypothetical protein [Shewanella aestuarii]GGN69604.1 hypothetical protein GCM10009193_03720 [Shewanella aestuarii]
MKNKLIIAVCLAALSSTSAYAINAKYREQLIRSGCTQVSERQGCDITKSKAENAKAGFVTEAPVQDANVNDITFHATGSVSCSLGDAQGSLQCEFGVIRTTLGNAEVHVTPPDGLKRILIFSGEKVSSDRYSTVKVSKKQDLWLIDVNDYEHYQISDAMIFGD